MQTGLWYTKRGGSTYSTSPKRFLVTIPQEQNTESFESQILRTFAHIPKGLFLLLGAAVKPGLSVNPYNSPDVASKKPLKVTEHCFFSGTTVLLILIFLVGFQIPFKI